eukprot:scaffold376_cov454-Pavlova_lutheri.AAC.10
MSVEWISMSSMSTLRKDNVPKRGFIIRTNIASALANPIVVTFQTKLLKDVTTAVLSMSYGSMGMLLNPSSASTEESTLDRRRISKSSSILGRGYRPLMGAKFRMR